jgi:hypothetical protein
MLHGAVDVNEGDAQGTSRGLQMPPRAGGETRRSQVLEYHDGETHEKKRRELHGNLSVLKVASSVLSSCCTKVRSLRYIGVTGLLNFR